MARILSVVSSLVPLWAGSTRADTATANARALFAQHDKPVTVFSYVGIDVLRYFLRSRPVWAPRAAPVCGASRRNSGQRPLATFLSYGDIAIAPYQRARTHSHPFSPFV
jgi:hypothetical protein